MKQISMHDLKEKLDQLSERELILDVRSPEEYREGHVPGSRNISHEEVCHHLDELKAYQTVYVHCQAGGRAGKAVEALQKAGLSNLVCVAGSGMGDWLAAGYQVEK